MSSDVAGFIQAMKECLEIESPGVDVVSNRTIDDLPLTTEDIDDIQMRAIDFGDAYRVSMCFRARAGDTSATNACKMIVHGIGPRAGGPAAAAKESAELKTLRSRPGEKHGPNATGAAGPCDPGCLKCANERDIVVTISPDPDGGTHYVEEPMIGVGITSFPDGLAEFPPFMCVASDLLSDDPFITMKCPEDTPESLRKRLGLPNPIIAKPPQPLDVEYDGVTLRELLADDHSNRHEWAAASMTPAQRAAVSAHLSAELRAKVAASEAADRERDQRQVLVDLEDG